MSITIKCDGLKTSDGTITLPSKIMLRNKRVVCVYADGSEAEYESLDAAMAAHKAIDPYDGRNESGELIIFSAIPKSRP